MPRWIKVFTAIGLFLYLVVQILAIQVGRKRDLNAFQRTVVYFASPVQSLVTGVFESVGGIFTHYVYLVGISKENDQLKKERNELFGKISRLHELEIENARLRELVQLEAATGLNITWAERVGTGASPFDQIIRIAKGEKQGVGQGMPVVHPRGLVGQVIQTSKSASDVMLLVDSSSAVDVVSQRSRSRGILRGRSRRELEFQFLPRSEDFKVGDEVVTSGLDGVFPKGLSVGLVSEVKEGEKGLFLKAKVKPHVDFSKLEEVGVILGGNP